MNASSPYSSLMQKIRWSFRLRGPAADDPTARTLHVLMLMLLVLVSFHIGFAELRNPHKVLVTLIGIPMIFAPLTTLLLLRKNRVRAAGVVYLTGMWVAFTAIIVFNGGIRHVGLAVYIALAVSAAWLFGYAAALWTAATCVTFTFVMAMLETQGLGPPRLLPGTPLGVWLLVIESTLMGVVPVSMILTSLRQALAESQRAQAELQVHQQDLEHLVQQRTAELVEARDQAQTASLAKGVFLTNMSHELRTPLNAILGLSRLLRRDPGLTDRHRKDLEIINDSGEHLLSLIDDVLDVAKIEAGRMALGNSSFQLHDVLRVSVELNRPRAEEKGLALTFQQSAHVPRFVHGDSGKLRQMLINLLSNAVKYTAQGSVLVTADAEQAANGLTLILEIADTGIGIAPQDQARIFEPFLQAGNNGTQKGTGLGLAITKRFVELMGGKISLQSTVGAGSVFRVEVPVEEVAEPAAAGTKSAKKRVVGLAPEQPAYRILIVEDETANWMVLERILHGAGFQVQIAETGEAAVHLFSSWRPHFIWMDLGLPGIDGIEAARRIRREEGGSEIKIVALTASAFSTERDAVLAAGLDGFLRKPYRPEEIFDYMESLLGVRYRYTEDIAQDDVYVPLDPGSLVTLPPELREGLEQSLLRLDPGAIAAAIDRISEFDASLARTLRSSADQLAYSTIFAALTPVRGGAMRESA